MPCQQLTCEQGTRPAEVCMGLIANKCLTHLDLHPVEGCAF